MAKNGRPKVNVLERMDYSKYFYALSLGDQSIKNLSKVFGVSESAVYQRINIMAERGFIIIESGSLKYNIKKPNLDYESLAEQMLDMLMQYFDNSKKELCSDNLLSTKLMTEISNLNYYDFRKYKHCIILQKMILYYLKDAYNNAYFHRFSLRDTLTVFMERLFTFDKVHEHKFKVLLNENKNKDDVKLFKEFYLRYIKIMKKLHEYYPEIRMIQDSIIHSLMEARK